MGSFQTIVEAKTQRAAENQAMKSAQQTFGPNHCLQACATEATTEDLEWVRGMGGWIPKGSLPDLPKNKEFVVEKVEVVESVLSIMAKNKEEALKIAKGASQWDRKDHREKFTIKVVSA